eukprot:c10119_g1_i1.p1 GENE.c10119_g1_i1~~c10119_g1_i1.p1  ORF type:complete len:616 (+),score=156.26 c10119_g1_i1:24-1850(+)
MRGKAKDSDSDDASPASGSQKVTVSAHARPSVRFLTDAAELAWVWQFVEEIQSVKPRPLIQCVSGPTNMQAMASALLSIGAVPQFTVTFDEVEEAADLMSQSHGAMCALTRSLTGETRRALMSAAAACKAEHIPWVLNARGCAHSKHQTCLIGELLKTRNIPSAIMISSGEDALAIGHRLGVHFPKDTKLPDSGAFALSNNAKEAEHTAAVLLVLRPLAEFLNKCVIVMDWPPAPHPAHANPTPKGFGFLVSDGSLHFRVSPGLDALLSNAQYQCSVGCDDMYAVTCAIVAVFLGLGQWKKQMKLHPEETPPPSVLVGMVFVSGRGWRPAEALLDDIPEPNLLTIRIVLYALQFVTMCAVSAIRVCARSTASASTSTQMPSQPEQSHVTHSPPRITEKITRGSPQWHWSPGPSQPTSHLSVSDIAEGSSDTGPKPNPPQHTQPPKTVVASCDDTTLMKPPITTLAHDSPMFFIHFIDALFGIVPWDPVAAASSVHASPSPTSHPLWSGWLGHVSRVGDHVVHRVELDAQPRGPHEIALQRALELRGYEQVQSDSLAVYLAQRRERKRREEAKKLQTEKLDVLDEWEMVHRPGTTVQPNQDWITEIRPY